MFGDLKIGHVFLWTVGSFHIKGHDTSHIKVTGMKGNDWDSCLCERSSNTQMYVRMDPCPLSRGGPNITCRIACFNSPKLGVHFKHGRPVNSTRTSGTKFMRQQLSHALLLASKEPPCMISYLATSATSCSWICFVWITDLEGLPWTLFFSGKWNTIRISWPFHGP